MTENVQVSEPLRDFLARCEGQMREFGCVIIWGLDPTRSAPPFAYTVGLSERYKQPEMILFGFGHDDSLVILNTIVRRYLRGGFWVPRDLPIPRVLDGASVIVKSVPVERARRFARFAVERSEQLGRKVQVQQVVVPDNRGVFPWERGYDKRALRAQPQLFEMQ